MTKAKLAKSCSDSETKFQPIHLWWIASVESLRISDLSLALLKRKEDAQLIRHWHPVLQRLLKKFWRETNTSNSLRTLTMSMKVASSSPNMRHKLGLPINLWTGATTQIRQKVKILMSQTELHIKGVWPRRRVTMIWSKGASGWRKSKRDTNQGLPAVGTILNRSLSKT